MIDVDGYNPAISCAPNANVAECLMMIVHIMLDSVRNGRRSGSMGLSTLNQSKPFNILSYFKISLTLRLVIHHYFNFFYPHWRQLH